MQQSVLARGFKKGIELCAEEGPDSPDPTAKLGEGLGPTLFMAQGSTAAAALQVQTIHPVFGRSQV